EVVRHAPVVSIVALQEPGKTTERGYQVVMVKQYRAPVEEEVLELVAGHVDEGESPLEAARRELREETGFAAEEWTELGTLYSSPGFTDERATIFIARGLSHVGAELDAGETLSLHFVPFTMALASIKSGEIRDAKSVAGLLWASFQLEYEQHRG
ncbi:MAG: NUDIX hydrolase, partial [Ardenticatenales bacterium]|nr:NUDIX hydrolase [Ardenticatenales bacterium]